MDLDRGRKIGVGFAKRLNQDSDGSRRAGLPCNANGSERSAKHKDETYCTRRPNHDENLPFRTCGDFPKSARRKRFSRMN